MRRYTVAALQFFVQIEITYIVTMTTSILSLPDDVLTHILRILLAKYVLNLCEDEENHHVSIYSLANFSIVNKRFLRIFQNLFSSLSIHPFRFNSSLSHEDSFAEQFRAQIPFRDCLTKLHNCQIRTLYLDNQEQTNDFFGVISNPNSPLRSILRSLYFSELHFPFQDTSFQSCHHKDDDNSLYKPSAFDVATMFCNLKQLSSLDICNAPREFFQISLPAFRQLEHLYLRSMEQNTLSMLLNYLDTDSANSLVSFSWSSTAMDECISRDDVSRQIQYIPQTGSTKKPVREIALHVLRNSTLSTISQISIGKYCVPTWDKSSSNYCSLCSNFHIDMQKIRLQEFSTNIEPVTTFDVEVFVNNSSVLIDKPTIFPPLPTFDMLIQSRHANIFYPNPASVTRYFPSSPDLNSFMATPVLLADDLLNIANIASRKSHTDCLFMPSPMFSMRHLTIPFSTTISSNGERQRLFLHSTFRMELLLDIMERVCQNLKGIYIGSILEVPEETQILALKRLISLLEKLKHMEVILINIHRAVLMKLVEYDLLNEALQCVSSTQVIHVDWQDLTEEYTEGTKTFVSWVPRILDNLEKQLPNLRILAFHHSMLPFNMSSMSHDMLIGTDFEFWRNLKQNAEIAKKAVTDMKIRTGEQLDISSTIHNIDSIVLTSTELLSWYAK